MPNVDVPQVEIDELVRRTTEAAQAYIRGDLRAYLELIPHSDDYTLLQPFGGELIHGIDDSSEHAESLARFFGGGEADVDVVATHASGDLVVLVVFERQHGEVGGLPDQDWSLRVTLVFRREDGEWRLVHRHADALVHPIDLEQLSVLARG